MPDIIAQCATVPRQAARREEIRPARPGKISAGGAARGGDAVTGPVGQHAGSVERTLRRRSLLIFSAAAGLTLTGCTDSPLVPGPIRKQRPTPTPTPLPGTTEAATTERELADYADAVLRRHRTKLDKDRRRLLEQIRDAHCAHLTALTAADPFTPQHTDSSPTPTPPIPSSPEASSSPSATPSPAVSGSSSTAIKRLISLESDAGAEHRRRALGPTGPDDQLSHLVLLWGSLSTAAAGYAAALDDDRRPATAPAQHRAAVTLPDAAQAAESLLQQCHAIIFGYQAALAELSGGRADHARATLSGYRALRDRLVEELTDDDHDLPAPHAGYQLPVQPTTATRAGKLIGAMETAMLPFIGQWLATTKDRKAALAAMIDNSRDALAWTSVITVWPGWPSQQ